MSIWNRYLVIGLMMAGVTSAVATTRVAYTRPGTMIKIPTSSVSRVPYLFRTGFGTEIHNFDPLNTAKGVYFDMEVGRNFMFGFSSIQGGDTTSMANIGIVPYTAPVEFGFHLQQRVYSYNDISLSLGLQDIVFQNAADGLSLDPKQLSFFAVVSSEKALGKYAMNTYMGFGTGGLAPEDTLSAAADTSEGTNAGVFAGFILKTPYLQKWGGLDLVGEFDGTGVNVGLRIPLTSDYRLNLGFTHIEKLPDWKSRYWSGHPGITLGLDMAVPRAGKTIPGTPGGPFPMMGRTDIKLPGLEAGGPLSAHMDTTLMAADLTVHTLRDSMNMMNSEMRNLMIRLASKEQHSQFLEDSLKSMKLDRNVTERSMNEAMRHLSRSLRYFYAGDYRESLKEVETALDLNPNLALAYARRGSIYYKLGDVQRATINWNLALRLDPEYDDVRNILKALHENRLKSTSFIKE